MDKINWHVSEWHDHPDAVLTELGGFIADVYPFNGRWIAKVSVTSEISEYPEVHCFRFKSTRDEAMAYAEQELRLAVSDWKEAHAVGFGDSQERG